jgi:hypothetical protein
MQMIGGGEKVWKDCGYISLTKDGKKVRVTVKRQYYIADLEEVRRVMDGKMAYTLILEPLKS